MPVDAMEVGFSTVRPTSSGLHFNFGAGNKQSQQRPGLVLGTERHRSRPFLMGHIFTVS